MDLPEVHGDNLGSPNEIHKKLPLVLQDNRFIKSKRILPDKSNNYRNKP
jgi:hypothetical protein